MAFKGFWLINLLFGTLYNLRRMISEEVILVLLGTDYLSSYPSSATPKKLGVRDGLYTRNTHHNSPFTLKKDMINFNVHAFRWSLLLTEANN